MANYHDEDACEAFEDGWKAGEKPKEPETPERDECVPIEGRMLPSGTPQKIGVMLAQFLGTERIRCTIEWSADWEGF